MSNVKFYNFKVRGFLLNSYEDGNLVEIKSPTMTFAIAKDSMGTQICYQGMFFPNANDFGSVENAVNFLLNEDNLEKAEKYFSENVADYHTNLFQIMMGMAGNLGEDDEN